MYEVAKFVLLGVIALGGIFMAVYPQKAVKQEERENEVSLADTRKKGIIVTAAAIVCSIVLAFIQLKV